MPDRRRVPRGCGAPPTRGLHWRVACFSYDEQVGDFKRAHHQGHRQPHRATHITRGSPQESRRAPAGQHPPSSTPPSPRCRSPGPYLWTSAGTAWERGRLANPRRAPTRGHGQSSPTSSQPRGLSTCEDCSLDPPANQLSTAVNEAERRLGNWSAWLAAVVERAEYWLIWLAAAAADSPVEASVEPVEQSVEAVQHFQPLL